MPLDINIGYLNEDTSNLEPKKTPTDKKKPQTPNNFTDADANAIVDFIKEDRVQINTNEYDITQNTYDISSKAYQTDLDNTNSNVSSIDSRVGTIEGDYLTSTDKTDLQNNIDLKADISIVPTKTSDLVNDGSNGSNFYTTKEVFIINASITGNDTIPISGISNGFPNSIIIEPNTIPSSTFRGSYRIISTSGKIVSNEIIRTGVFSLGDALVFQLSGEFINGDILSLEQFGGSVGLVVPSPFEFKITFKYI